MVGNIICNWWGYYIEELPTEKEVKFIIFYMGQWVKCILYLELTVPLLKCLYFCAFKLGVGSEYGLHAMTRGLYLVAFLP